MRLIQKALTFDDVLLVPAYSNILPRDATLVSKVSRNINLNIPLVSAAMDTVTESRLAIALAQEGGIGIIHKNLTAARQAAEVQQVKNFEAGVIREPFTVGPDTTIGEVLKLTRARRISGRCGRAERSSRGPERARTRARARRAQPRRAREAGRRAVMRRPAEIHGAIASRSSCA